MFQSLLRGFGAGRLRDLEIGRLLGIDEKSTSVSEGSVSEDEG